MRPRGRLPLRGAARGGGGGASRSANKRRHFAVFLRYTDGGGEAQRGARRRLADGQGARRAVPNSECEAENSPTRALAVPPRQRTRLSNYSMARRDGRGRSTRLSPTRCPRLFCHGPLPPGAKAQGAERPQGACLRPPASKHASRRERPQTPPEFIPLSRRDPCAVFV